MKIIKNVIAIFLLTLITFCAFGGGCLIWTAIAIILKPSPMLAEIMFYLSALVPVPFCWWLAPKISDKIL